MKKLQWHTEIDHLNGETKKKWIERACSDFSTEKRQTNKFSFWEVLTSIRFLVCQWIYCFFCNSQAIEFKEENLILFITIFYCIWKTKPNWRQWCVSVQFNGFLWLTFTIFVFDYANKLINIFRFNIFCESHMTMPF